MVLFEIFGSKKFDPNIHQSAPNCTILKKFLGWGKTPNPPNKEHGFAMLRMSLGDMQISKSHKIIGPPSQTWGRPCTPTNFNNTHFGALTPKFSYKSYFFL